MNIIVNNEAFELSPEQSSGDVNGTKATLSDLLRVLKFQSLDGLALAVNDAVVSRDKWELFSLSENDNVLIITATQGG